MIMQHGSPEVFNRFREVAGQFCAVVDSARSVERDDLVLKIYRLLPLLIGEAIGKLGDWNLYSQVFDPTKDREASTDRLPTTAQTFIAT
jgi:hypothetical protein